jgi:hypothetical protein
MSFAIQNSAIRENSVLGGSPFLITKSDTLGTFTDNGTYPRGFIVGTGGTLTVFVQDFNNPGYSKKSDLGEVSDGFVWQWGGVFGFAIKDEAGVDTTATNIIAIP